MTSSTNRVAIVTGASRGIGAAIARRLASDGLAVIVNYAGSAGAAATLVEEIEAAGGRASPVQADISDPAAVKRMFDAAEAAYGGVDVLVNNAGIMKLAPLAQVDDAAFDHIIAINLKGTFNGLREAANRLRDGGRIVNFSTNLIYQPRLGSGLYAASKAAVSVLTNALAKELGPRGITVNAVAPSMTRTDMTAATPPARREAVMAATPLGRIGEPEDVADVVAFLASDESRWVTGRTLLTDGGLTDAL